jgi:hypothetical protein
MRITAGAERTSALAPMWGVVLDRSVCSTPPKGAGMRTSKLFPLSGIVFVVLVVGTVAGIGGSTPGTDASAAKLASFYNDHDVRQGVATFLLAASVPFVVFFGIGLATALASRAAGGTSAWGHVLIAGTILVAGAVLLTAFAHFALANGGDEKISPAALQALNSLDGNTWMAFNPAFGVMMLGAAGVLISARVLSWLGWIALVLGIAAFVPFADFFALLATLAWIFVTSIVLARGKAEPAYAVAHGTA